MKKKLRRAVEALKAYEPDKIYLFGSWAKGEEDELSDMDFVLIKKTRKPFMKRLHDVCKLLPADIGGVDVLVYTPSEFRKMEKEGNAFVEMIIEEGRLIHGR